MTEAPRAEPVRPVAVEESRGACCGNVSATRAAKAYRSKTLETRNADRFAAPAPPVRSMRPPLSPSNRLFLRVLACWTRFRAKAPL